MLIANFYILLDIVTKSIVSIPIVRVVNCDRLWPDAMDSSTETEQNILKKLIIPTLTQVNIWLLTTYLASPHSSRMYNLLQWPTSKWVSIAPFPTFAAELVEQVGPFRKHALENFNSISRNNSSKSITVRPSLKYVLESTLRYAWARKYSISIISWTTWSLKCRRSLLSPQLSSRISFTLYHIAVDEGLLFSPLHHEIEALSWPILCKNNEFANNCVVLGQLWKFFLHGICVQLHPTSFLLLFNYDLCTDKESLLSHMRDIFTHIQLIKIYCKSCCTGLAWHSINLFHY